VPLEKFLARRVSVHHFVADRSDVPHLNVIVARRPAIGPDDTASPCIAPMRQHPQTFGSNHLMYPKPADLLAIAKRQLHLGTPPGVLDEYVEDPSGC